MTTQLRSLCWKTWTEYRGLFWLNLTVLFGFLGYCLAYEFEYRTRAFIASYYTLCLMLSLLGSILLAMSTATGEYRQRSLIFSSALPVSLRTIAWGRLLGAWFCLVAPILLGALLSTLFYGVGWIEQAGLRPGNYNAKPLSLPDRPSLPSGEAMAFLWTATTLASLIALFRLTLISLLGSFCRSEGSVGFLGAIVSVLGMVTMSLGLTLRQHGSPFLAQWLGAVAPESLAISWGYGDLDGSSYSDLELAPVLLAPLLLNGVLTLGLGFWFSRRYGRRLAADGDRSPSRRRWFRPTGWRLISRLGLRWPNQTLALIWLNARQSLPLCLSGLAIAIFLACIQDFSDDVPDSLRDRGVSVRDFSMKLAGQLPATAWFVGMLWGTIAAVGVFSSELKSSLEQFWRSRPISPTQWFWMKFSVGLAIFLMSLDIFPAVASWLSSVRPEMGRVGVAYLACIPLIHLLIYSLAVAAICYLRRPILAAITALLAFYVWDAMLSSLPTYPILSTLNVYNELDALEFDRNDASVHNAVNLLSHGYPLVYGLAVGIVVISLLLARRMIRNPTSTRLPWIRLGILGLLLIPSSLSAGDPLTDELVQGIQRNLSQRKSQHLRFQHKKYPPSEMKQLLGENPRHDTLQPAGKGAVVPEEEWVIEQFDRPPQHVWKQSDTQGLARNIWYYNDKDLYQLPIQGGRPTGVISNFNLQSVQQTSPSPSGLLESLDGEQILDLLKPSLPHTIQTRTVNGERLIDVRIQHTQVVPHPDGTAHTQEVTYNLTWNASRNFWPVSLEKANGNGRRIFRKVLLKTSGWINSGGFNYPQYVEKLILTNSNTSETSQDLVLDSAATWEIQQAEINQPIPDSVFQKPFPEGTIFHDSRERRWLETDANGALQPYLPKRKGVRGAVLMYHLLWITVASVVLWRRSRTTSDSE